MARRATQEATVTRIPVKPVSLRGPRQIRTLLSSGELVGRPGDAPVPPPGHATHLWQYDALNYFDAVPELKAITMWEGNCGSRIRLVPGLYDDYGAVQTSFDDVDTEPPPALAEAAEYVAALQDRLGGQSEIMRAIFENTFITGEGYLVGYDGVEGENWEFLSINELRPVGNATRTSGQRFARMWGPGLSLEELAPDTFVARLWRPHRRFKRLADSSVHGCLEILEELVLLTHGVRAAQVSRLRGAGVWLIPTNSVRGFGEGNEEGSEEDDPFMRDFMEAMVNPIEDPASSSRCVPLVVEMEREDILAAREGFMSFGDLDRGASVVERREAIERLAMGLDAPPERVLGHQGTTFANAAAVTEDEFRTHLEPTAILACSGLTTTYLAQRFRKAHAIKDDRPLPDEFARIAVGYDASRLIARPDRSKEIIDLVKAAPWMLSMAAVRRGVGLEEADAPDDAEIEETLHYTQRFNTRGTIRITEGESANTPAVEKILLADPDANLDDPALRQQGLADATPGDAANAPAVTPPPAPEDAQPPMRASGAPDPAWLFSLRASAATDLAVTLAVESAGRRLRGKARGAAKQALDGIPNDAVARTLGPAAVAKLQGNDDPFNGEIAALGSLLARLAADAGLRQPASVAGRLVALAEKAAEARMFDGGAALSADMLLEAVGG